MSFCTYLPTLLATLLGAEDVLDDMQYADPPAARQAWVSAERTPPVEVQTVDDGRAVVVSAPFAADKRVGRAVVDRRVELDLSEPGTFALELAIDEPKAVSGMTLYFRSGNGWYGCGASLRGSGRQTLRFSKSRFRIEENPTGWDKIDGIRIAAWRGQDLDARLVLHRLSAITHDVAVVLPGEAPSGELRAARQAAGGMIDALTELGLEADAIPEASVAAGMLGSRRVAILAYNPRLSASTVRALVQFVEGGGKVFACYGLPGPLAEALGLAPGKYVRPEPNTLAEVRFQPDAVPGLPPAMKQASWNITVTEPVGHGARAIGHWHNTAGEPTSWPAMFLSERGAYFSHIVLSDDPPAKLRMLAAVLGHFHPPLWETMAGAALQRALRVGHCQSLEELRELVEATGRDEARRLFQAVVRQRARSEELLNSGEPAGAVEAASESRRLAAEAYLRSAPSPATEGRAVWNHSGMGAYPGDWDKSARLLAENGFNMVFPNMLWGGLAHYASDLLPRSRTFEEHGDQIVQCCAAAKKHGLEVHVWKVNYNAQNAPKQFLEQMAREGRLQYDVKGERHNWLCPSHPANQKLELESMIEVARNYPVDGIHFDYIRYPNREYCYCDGCRERFEAASGRKVAEWPRECYSGPRRDEYNDWRCQQITALVEAVHREGKKLRPELKISAAVFGHYPGCRESVAQDWVAWVEAGYLDFLCPMDYTDSDERFCGLVENQLKLVAGRMPVYPGIGASAPGLPPDRVVGQIHHARRLGAPGFTVFEFSARTADTMVPGVGLGAGRQRARPWE
ncbi:MAG: family 10 glycosylhydrolase [Thermoguttaceae bacterium]|jgi:uncharacterized lipoprotein YddW (UPF0748 family)|nr:family 10 glycosylhydrolase [Thermoguttaceae bacterium]